MTFDEWWAANAATLEIDSPKETAKRAWADGRFDLINDIEDIQSSGRSTMDVINMLILAKKNRDAPHDE